MKKLLVCLIALIFLFGTGSLYAGEKGGHKKENDHDRSGTYQKYDNRSNYKEHKTDTRHDYNRNLYSNNYQPNPHHYKGYHNKYRGTRHQHPQNYRGHWGSWNEWEKYHNRNRSQHRNGRYYRDSNGSLYFAFDTNEGSFAFSIGR